MKTGFLYFVESTNAIDDKFLTELKLGYAFEGLCTRTPINSGPDKLKGQLFADARFPIRKLAYRPDVQKWRSIPGKPVWIGMWKDDRPGPSSLLRKRVFEGPEVELCDGNKWQIPLVRDASNGTNLPILMDMDADGKWIAGGLEPDHEFLFNRCLQFLQFTVASLVEQSEESLAKGDHEEDMTPEDVKIEFDFDDLIPTAAGCLGLNYRVSQIEIAMLGLFDNASASKILCAATDWEELVARMEAAAKKNDQSPQGAGSTSAGNGTMHSTTSQPVPTS